MEIEPGVYVFGFILVTCLLANAIEWWRENVVVHRRDTTDPRS